MTANPPVAPSADAPPADPPTPVFTIARSFAAPPARVWTAWTEPDRLARWFGPKGVVTTILACDLRPGGRLHGRMDPPAGAPFWFRFDWREIVPDRRLVWEHAFADEAGALAPSPFGGPWPRRILSEVNFTPEGEGTRIDVRWTPLDATREEQAAFAAECPGMTGGWTISLDQLEDELGG